MERYFLGSNTEKGFCGFYNETTDKIGAVYLLKGGAGTGKSSLIKKVLKAGLDKGFKCESWHCSGDPNSLDGVYIKDLDVTVIDATSPHAVEPKIPVVKDNIVNLLDYASKGKIVKYRDVIEKMSNDKKRCYVCGYEHLNIAFCHFKQIERIVSTSMKGDEIRLKAKDFALDILKELRCINDGVSVGCDDEKTGGVSAYGCKEKYKISKRFFRAITPDGIAIYLDHLKDKNIWHIKGEMASVDLFLKTALDVVMKEVSKVVVFFNPLSTDIIDGFMVGDVVVYVGGDKVDGAMVYDLSWYEGDFDRYAVSRAKMKMKEEIELATDYFAKARSVHLSIEKYYVSAMDFDGINHLTDKLLVEIFDKE